MKNENIYEVTEAEKEIFRKVQHCHYMEDVKNHIEFWVGQSEIPEGIASTFTTKDYDLIAEDFERRIDCNVPFNDVIDQCIFNYVKAYKGKFFVSVTVILRELGANKSFDENGKLTDEGKKAIDKLVSVSYAFDLIGVMHKSGDDLKNYIYTILGLEDEQ